MVREHLLAILILLILSCFTSTAIGSTISPYSVDFDLHNMAGFDDNTIRPEDILAFVQEKYPNSPMLSEDDFGSCFISAGQANNVNPAFLVATACLEGGFGTLGWAASHPECHNTFGYGIPTGTTPPDDLNCMDSWCAMVQRIASVIAHGHNYYTQGFYTVSQVRAKYAAIPNEDSIASLMNELYTFSLNRKATSPNEAVEAVSTGTKQGPQTINPEIDLQKTSPMQVASITGFKWIGMDDDKIGQRGGVPDKDLDGHFLLNLDLPYPTEIASISIYSTDEMGNPSGGQVWETTAKNQHWLLGVFDKDTQLNVGYVPSLGIFSGRVQFDLYVANSGWFKPGNWFEVTVNFGELQKQTTIPLV